MKLSIDYSLNSPALCVYEVVPGLTVDEVIAPRHFYFVAQKKCQIGDFYPGPFELHGAVIPDYTIEIHRYLNNAEFVLQAIIKHDVDEVYIEGYSYGSKSSSVTTLAENVATLKLLCYQKGVPVTPFAPGMIKKVGTGKGNADKSMMYEAWQKRFPTVDLESLLKAKRDGNPISDLVDSYFIAETALSRD